MGILDWPAGLLDLIARFGRDAVPDFAWWGVWGAACGALSMLLYSAISPQRTLRLCRERVEEALKTMRDVHAEPSEILKAFVSLCRNSARRIALALGPALIAAYPLLGVLVWMDSREGHVMPAAGERILVHVEPGDADVTWRGVHAEAQGPGVWSVTWPEPDSSAMLVASDGRPLVRLPPDYPVSGIGHRSWLAYVAANPAGYLPDDADVKVVRLALAPADTWDWLPRWLPAWLVIFLVGAFAASIGLQLRMKVA